jgi:hypothetical protein
VGKAKDRKKQLEGKEIGEVFLEKLKTYFPWLVANKANYYKPPQRLSYW